MRDTADLPWFAGAMNEAANPSLGLDRCGPRRTVGCSFLFSDARLGQSVAIAPILTDLPLAEPCVGPTPALAVRAGSSYHKCAKAD
jgi:hypothetical protein